MVLPIRTDGITQIDAQPGEDASTAFLRAFTKDAKEPSAGDDEEDKKHTQRQPAEEPDEDPSEETPDEDDEQDGQDDEDNEEGEDEQPARKRVVLEPDAEAFVKHKVDGKDVEIPVKDLTRLYGQEAALTRKSQETAEKARQVDEQGTKYTTGLEALLSRAVEKYKPYAELDFFALAKDPSIDAATLAAVRKEAQAAYNDVAFLNAGLEQAVKEAETARKTNLTKAARDTWAVLSDPKTGIDGWSEPLYNDMRAYAKSQGADPRMVDELVDATSLKIIHKAMMFDKGQKANVQVVKKDKEPKRIIKSAPDQSSVRTPKSNKNADAALARLASTGSMDDAQAVFLARMKQ